MKLPALALRSLIILAVMATAAMADSMTYQLTVEAGKHDRMNAPVCAVLQESEVQANLNPVLLAKAKSVVLTDSEDRQLPAQLTAAGLLQQDPNGVVVRELHFIIPSLKKGDTLRLTAALSDNAPTNGGFRWADAPGQFAELFYENRPAMRYMAHPLDESSKEAREKTYKVFHHLYDPAGTRFVTKGPGGKYSHHRGLFYGFNRISYGDVERVDTWHCGGDAHQSHQAFLAQEAGPVLGRHRVEIDWHGVGKKVFATEEREMTVYRVPGGHLVEFASCLKGTDGPVKLDGDPQHAGFQFRAAQEVADGDQKLTYYVRPDGQGQPGETRNWSSKNADPGTVNLPWNAMSFVIDGTRYTAVYLDKPTNPKEARYSERTYGRFGSYFEYQLDEDNRLDLGYRVWLQKGEMTVDEAARLRADFVEPPEVVLR